MHRTLPVFLNSCENESSANKFHYHDKSRGAVPILIPALRHGVHDSRSPDAGYRYLSGGNLIHYPFLAFKTEALGAQQGGHVERQIF